MTTPRVNHTSTTQHDPTPGKENHGKTTVYSLLGIPGYQQPEESHWIPAAPNPCLCQDLFGFFQASRCWGPAKVTPGARKILLRCLECLDKWWYIIFGHPCYLWAPRKMQNEFLWLGGSMPCSSEDRTCGDGSCQASKPHGFLGRSLFFCKLHGP